MSHIAEIELHIKDLPALRAACKRIGLEFREGQQTFLWYAGQRNPCLHAIGVPGKADAYEIGVVERKDKLPGFGLEYDPFMGGMGLVQLAGKECNRLRQAYAVEASRNAAKKQGFRVTGERTLENGSIQLVLAK